MAELLRNLRVEPHTCAEIVNVVRALGDAEAFQTHAQQAEGEDFHLKIIGLRDANRYRCLWIVPAALVERCVAAAATNS